MAFCPKCGASVSAGATFCGSCGSPLSAAAPVPPAAPPPIAQPPNARPQAAGTPMTSNVAGALCYVLGFITGIIFLVLDPYKNDRFVKFHAFQSIFLNAAMIAFWIVWAILSAIVFAIAVAGGFVGVLFSLFHLVGLVIWLALLALWVFMIYKAYNNERFMLPIIGAMAAKQAG